MLQIIHKHSQQKQPFKQTKILHHELQTQINAQQIQEISLETSPTPRQKMPRKRKQRKAKQLQTCLIKVKPISNSQKIVTDLKLSTQIKPKLKDRAFQNGQTQNQSSPIKQKQKEQADNLQSPVVYRFSDDEQINQKYQHNPKSSRRPFREQNGEKNYNNQFGSQTKLLRSERKVRSKNRIKRQNISKRRSAIENKEILDEENISPRQSPLYQYQQQNRYPNQSQDQKLQHQQQKQNHQNRQNQQSQQQSSVQSPSQDGEQDIGQQQKHQQNRLDEQKTSKEKQQQVVVLKSNSFYTLINAQIPEGNFITCIIRRKRALTFFDNFVVYEFYLLKDKKYLMTCVKNRLFSTTSHFQFYRQKSNSSQYHKQNLYAFLDSNFTGTEFVLKTISKNDTISERSTAVDKSQLSKHNQSTSSVLNHSKFKNAFENQKKKTKNQEKLKNNQRETCFISFKASFLGLAGQREAKLLKKKTKKLTKRGKFSDIKAAQQNGETDKYTQFQTKKAAVGKNGLQLDFKGVARMQSTKNMILQDSSSKEVLIFGKIKQDIYSVAVGSSLSIMDGLAFGIANLDRKFFVN